MTFLCKITVISCVSAIHASLVDTCSAEYQLVCADVQGRKDIVMAEYGGWYKAAAVDR